VGPCAVRFCSWASSDYCVEPTGFVWGTVDGLGFVRAASAVGLAVFVAWGVALTEEFVPLATACGLAGVSVFA
jgi:hypothetical protein